MFVDNGKSPTMSSMLKTGDVVDHPEIECAEFARADVRALYSVNGLFLVRGFLSPQEVATLQHICVLSFAIGETIATCVPPDQVPQEISDGLLTRGYLSWTRIKNSLRCAGTSLDARLAAIVDKIGTVAKAAFADPTVELLEGFSVIRRHRKFPRPGEATPVPWHRDFSFVGQAGIERSVNFWIPLAEVGEIAPSIELIVSSHRYMVNVPDDNPGVTNISEQWIADHLGSSRRWTPHCTPGDVIAFDHQTLHRTQPLDAPAQIDRMNFETRWAPSRKAASN